MITEIGKEPMCETCKFYVKIADSLGKVSDGVGWCTRFPPTAVSTPHGIEFYSPSVGASKLCGEFKRKIT